LANVVPFGHDKHNAMAGTMHNKVQEWLNIPMNGSIAIAATAGQKCLGENVINILTMSDSGEFYDIVFNKDTNSVIADSDTIGRGKTFKLF
jgi:hypothetical protein